MRQYPFYNVLFVISTSTYIFELSHTSLVDAPIWRNQGSGIFSTGKPGAASS